MTAAQSVEDLRALERLIGGMSPENRAELERMAAPILQRRFVPLPGQQALAYDSKADVLGYGGSAGGGKSYLMVGLAATQHHRSLIVRREASELDGLIADSRIVFGDTGSFVAGNVNEWTFDKDKSLKFGGMKEPDDWRKYAGRPRDLIAFDEAAEFLEVQVAALLAWNRSSDIGQRCRMVLATNPPRSAEGEWFLRWFAPWLDPVFPDPAVPGELRYGIRVNDKLEWVQGPGEYERGGEEYTALSYTFIPAQLNDNPFLADTDYRKRLQNLPGALRAQLLHGDFLAGAEDDEWQTIPTAWIKAAQERWKPNGNDGLQMTAVGVDVAQGGGDKSVLAARYGTWYAPLQRKPGADTPDTPSMVGFIVAHQRNSAVLVIDIGGGYGVGPALFMKENGATVSQFDGSKPSTKVASGSRLGFYNLRAEAWWRFREALDPGQEGGSPIALPPDQSLVADLAAPRYSMTPRGIKIEAKEDVKKRLGRSPDDGDATVMAWSQGNALALKKMRGFGHAGLNGRMPQVHRGYEKLKVGPR